MTKHRHDAILDAARDIVREEGSNSLSIRKVAKRAGVSVGAVQYYYDSVAQLLDAVTDPWHDQLSAIVQVTMADFPSVESPRQRLLDMCVEIYRSALDHEQLLRTRHLETMRRRELTPRRADQADGWSQRGAALAAARLGGSPASWTRLFLAIEMLIVGFALSDRIDEDQEALEAFLRDAIDGMARGVFSNLD